MSKERRRKASNGKGFVRSHTLKELNIKKVVEKPNPGSGFLPSINKAGQTHRDNFQTRSSFNSKERKSSDSPNDHNRAKSIPKAESREILTLREAAKSTFASQKNTPRAPRGRKHRTRNSVIENESTRVSQTESPDIKISPIEVGKRDKLPLLFMVTYKEEMNEHLEELQTRERSGDFLLNHPLTEYMRTKIIDWIHQILVIYEFGDRTFFTTVKLLDKYLAKTQKETLGKDLHLLSITLMSIASKFEEKCPFIMDEIYEKLGHKLFSREEITRKEIEVLQTLEFSLSTVSGFDFLHQFNFLFLFEAKSSMKMVRSLAILMLKINTMDYEMCGVLPSLQAASAIYLALTICEDQFNCTLIDTPLLLDLIKMSRSRLEDIQTIAEKTLHNIVNTREKFPKMGSMTNTYKNLIARFFSSIPSLEQ